MVVFMSIFRLSHFRKYGYITILMQELDMRTARGLPRLLLIISSEE